MNKTKAPKVIILGYTQMYNELRYAVLGKIYTIQNVSPPSFEKIEYFTKQGWYGKALKLINFLGASPQEMERKGI